MEASSHFCYHTYMKQDVSSSGASNGIEKDGTIIYSWIALHYFPKHIKQPLLVLLVKNHYHDVSSIIMKTETYLLDEEALL